MDNGLQFDALLYSKLDCYPVALPVEHSAADQGYLAVRSLCDGTFTLRQLLLRLDDIVALSHVLASVAWFCEPLLPTPPGKQRCLVLTPNSEQTFLSMSGYLLKRQGQLDCLNVIFFSDRSAIQQNGIPKASTDAWLSRRDEANICALATGIRNRFLEIPSHAIRSLACSSSGRMSYEDSFRRWLRMVLYCLIDRQRPTDVFAPAAIGIQPDSRVLFDATLQLFQEGYFPEVGYHFYEVLPQASQYIAIDDFMSSFENDYIAIAPWFDDVTAVYARRNEILRVIQARSALKYDYLAETIAKRNAILARKAHGALAERFWKLTLTFSTR